MKKSVKSTLAGILAVSALAFGICFAAPTSQIAFATDTTTGIKKGAEEAKSDDQQTELFGTDGIFKTIVNTALYLIGAISVIMLIYGGIRYTLSAGDAKGVEAAKNTILYAIIGIIVALLAYAIVNFVISKLVA